MPADRQVLNRAAVVILADRADQATIKVQADAGLSVPYAARPLFAHELVCRVRFADRGQVMDQGEDQARADASSMMRDLAAWITVTLAGVTVAQATSMAAAWLLSAPDEARQVLAASTAKLNSTYLATTAKAAALTIREAARQGAHPLRDLVAPPPSLARAAQVAGTGWNKAVGALTGLLAGQGPQALAPDSTLDPHALHDTLTGTSPAAAQDQAAQGSHGAYGDGVSTAVDALPEPDDIWASSLLDGNTCQACHRWDGQQFDSLADAKAVFPGMAGNRYCSGGARCRCSLVIDWPAGAGE